MVVKTEPLLAGATVDEMVAMVLSEVGGAGCSCSFRCFPQFDSPLREPYLPVTMCLYLSERILARGLSGSPLHYTRQTLQPKSNRT